MSYPGEALWQSGGPQLALGHGQMPEVSASALLGGGGSGQGSWVPSDLILGHAALQVSSGQVLVTIPGQELMCCTNLTRTYLSSSSLTPGDLAATLRGGSEAHPTAEGGIQSQAHAQAEPSGPQGACPQRRAQDREGRWNGIF